MVSEKPVQLRKENMGSLGVGSEQVIKTRVLITNEILAMTRLWIQPPIGTTQQFHA